MACVEKGLDNWFNSNTGFKSYESQQSDARAEQEVVAEEHKSGTHGDCAAWFYSNVNNADAANDAAIDDMWATIDGKMVAEQKVNAAEWQTNGWLSWDNDTVESTNKAHKSNLVAEGANASGCKDLTAAAAVLEQNTATNGWFSPLVNHFADPSVEH